MSPIAVLDANVLYPASLRDFLLRLAYDAIFTPRWSEEIQDEWTRNLQENQNDTTAAQINRTRTVMEAAFPEAMVTNYAHLIPELTNDPKDRHVLAVAIQGRAQQIVTRNLKDFREAALAPHSIQAIHPDKFTVSLYQNSPDDVIATIQNHRAQLTRPAKTAQEYLETLNQHLPQTVAALQKHLDEI